jgi:hypothetical protein
MTGFIRQRVLQIIYLVILWCPFGIVAPQLEVLDKLSPLGAKIIAIAILLYFIYAALRANTASKLVVFSERPFGVALLEARTQTNADLKVKVSFLPVIGPFFARLFRLNDTNERHL